MKSGKAQARQAKLYFERAQMVLVGNMMSHTLIKH